MRTIRSAGKVLSGTNEDSLMNSLMGILKVLISNKRDFNTIAKSIKIALGGEESTEGSDEEKAEGEIEAGRLSDNVRMATWFDNVSRSFAMSRDGFVNLFSMSDSQVEREYGAGIKREDLAVELIEDITQLLNEYKDNFPGKGDEPYYYYRPSYSDGFYASARPKAVEAAASDAKTEPQFPPTETSPPETEPTVTPPITIQASGRAQFNLLGVTSSDSEEHNKNLEFYLDFSTDQVREVIAFKQQANANTVPFEGVLFIIDEPSESAPAKGSSYPLYVPMDVAIQAAEALNNSGGLPLDVDVSLVCHSDTNIVGIMTSAEIRGKDFVVRGHLFARNQEERVSLIASNKDALGMSMNAFASGNVQQIDNVTAYCIETLELLGANILMADKATWQKTRVLAAQAATSPSETSGEIIAMTVDLNKLQEQMNQLTTSMDRVVTAQTGNQEQIDKLSRLMEQQGQILAQQGQVIQEITAERQQARLEAQSREEELKAESSQKQLAEVISNALSSHLENFQKTVLDQINPSRSPRPLTMRPAGLIPVVAGAEGTAEGSSEIKLSPAQYELLQAQAQLAGMEKSRHVGPDRVKLVEKCRLLKAQGVILPSGMQGNVLLTSII